MQPEPFAPQPQEPEQEPQTAPAQAPTEYPSFQDPQQNNPDYESVQPVAAYESSQPEPIEQQPNQAQSFAPAPQPQQYAEQAPLQNQQSQPATQPPFAPAGGYQIAAQDPGKTMGIIGLVFAFVGLQIIGLVLSIIAHNKSKKAGFKNGIAIAGIWLNIVSIIIAIISIVLFVLLAAFAGVQQAAINTESRTSAGTVLQITEVYAANNKGKYPTLSDLMTSTDPSITTGRDTLKATLVEGSSPKENQIGFDACFDAYGRVIGAHIYTYESTGTVTESATAGYCPASSES